MSQESRSPPATPFPNPTALRAAPVPIPAAPAVSPVYSRRMTSHDWAGAGVSVVADVISGDVSGQSVTRMFWERGRRLLGEECHASSRPARDRGGGEAHAEPVTGRSGEFEMLDLFSTEV